MIDSVALRMRSSHVVGSVVHRPAEHRSACHDVVTEHSSAWRIVALGDTDRQSPHPRRGVLRTLDWGALIIASNTHLGLPQCKLSD